MFLHLLTNYILIYKLLKKHLDWVKTRRDCKPKEIHLLSHCPKKMSLRGLLLWHSESLRPLSGCQFESWHLCFCWGSCHPHRKPWRSWLLAGEWSNIWKISFSFCNYAFQVDGKNVLKICQHSLWFPNIFLMTQ